MESVNLVYESDREGESGNLRAELYVTEKRDEEEGRLVPVEGW